MVTTMRSTRETIEEQENNFSSIDVLERKFPSNIEDCDSNSTVTESVEDVKLRMQQNLEKLLNYDKVMPETACAVATDVETETIHETEVNLSPKSDEDITPTSTTMQFGSEDREMIRQDMAKVNKVSDFALNVKAKVGIVLYSLAVVVVLALIVLNTGVLSVLNNDNKLKSQVLSEKQIQVQQLNDSINEISSNEHVTQIAENELDMIWSK